MRDADSPSPTPRFPLLSSVVLLTAVAAVMVGVAAATTPMAFPAAGDVTRTSVVAGGLVWAMSILSMLGLAKAAGYGLTLFAGVYLATTGLRLVGCLGGALALAAAGIVQGGKPLAVILAMTYLPLLVVEVAILNHFLKRRGYAGWEKPAGHTAPQETAA